MADDGPLSDFSFPASPGDHFPPIMGDPGEEAAAVEAATEDSDRSVYASSAGFIAPPTTNDGTLLGVNNRGYYCPMYLARPALVTALVIRTSVGGSAGAVARVGIYTADFRINTPANPQLGMPHRLLVDGGTIATTSVSQLTVGIGPTYVPRGVVWTVLVPQGSPVTQATFVGMNSPNPVMAGNLNVADRAGISEDSITGALTEFAGMSNTLIAEVTPFPFAMLSLERFLAT